MNEWILLTEARKPHINQRVQCSVESVSGQPHHEFLYLRQLGSEFFWDENSEQSNDFGSVYAFSEVAFWKEPDTLPYRPISPPRPLGFR